MVRTLLYYFSVDDAGTFTYKDSLASPSNEGSCNQTKLESNFKDELIPSIPPL